MASAVSRLMSVCRPLRHSKCPFCKAPVSRRSASTSSWVGTSSMAYLPLGDDSIVSEVFVVIHLSPTKKWCCREIQRSFSSTLRILSSICCSRSVRVPKRRLEVMRGTPIAEAQAGGDARHAHRVDDFVAAFDGGEHVVP